MTPENFVYWLQGWLEIQNPTAINEEQVQEIKNHIALVLKKETPNLKIDYTNFSNKNNIFKIQQNSWPFNPQYNGDFVSFPEKVNYDLNSNSSIMGVMKNLNQSELINCYDLIEQEGGLKTEYSISEDRSILNNYRFIVPIKIFHDNKFKVINIEKVKQIYYPLMFGFVDPVGYKAKYGYDPPASC